MRGFKAIIGFLVSALFISLIGGAISFETGLPAPAVIGGLFTFSLIPKALPAGVLNDSLDVELWKDWIVEKLFKNNEFLNFARNADDDVLNGRVVHIPNAGSPSRVKRNRNKLPATATKRGDKDVTYALDEFTSDPRLIEQAAEILSYDKMNSAMGQDMNEIKQLVAEWMLYHWRAEGDNNIIRTKGSSIAAHIGTGNRKALQLEQLDEARARMDEKNIPDDGRYAMFDARMYQQLIAALGPSDYKDFSRQVDISKGVVGELFNFKILKRSTVSRYSNAGTPAAKEPDSTVADTDNAGVKCWHEDWVERAIGTTNIFEDKNSPYYYGDAYSLLVNAGGRKIDADGDGVIEIVQASV